MATVFVRSRTASNTLVTSGGNTSWSGRYRGSSTTRRRNTATAESRRPRNSSAAPRYTSPLARRATGARSEEHTSELQSLTNLVCRLLLEKKKTQQRAHEPAPVHDPDVLPQLQRLVAAGVS